MPTRPRHPFPRRTLAATTVAVLATTLLVARTPSTTTHAQSAPSRIATMGVLYVGGSVVEPAGGTAMWVGQSEVHRLIPEPRLGVSILMVPGLNLSSTIYRTTPDGRKGWAQHFAEAGYDVYAFDDPLTSASGGMDINVYNAVRDGSRPPGDQPALGIWDMNAIWSRWGFGPQAGTPHPDVRFPVAHIDQFFAAFPFVQSGGGGGGGGGGRFGAGAKADNLVALIDAIEGPIVLMAHSAGSGTAVAAAAERPSRIAAFVMLEPAGGVPDGADYPGKALLGVYGDYIQQRRQGNRKTSTEEAARSFVAAGGRGAVISLPEDHGVRGNTHLYMQDDNNLQIADLIIDWLREDEPAPLPTSTFVPTAVPSPATPTPEPPSPIQWLLSLPKLFAE